MIRMGTIHEKLNLVGFISLAQIRMKLSNKEININHDQKNFRKLRNTRYKNKLNFTMLKQTIK